MTAATILAVDDTPQNLRLLEALLSTEGYEVLTAASGDEALRVVAERHPDLLLVDILMPGIDGYELCRRIRANEETRYLPIVLMTASIEQDKARALESGADDFVQKPVLQHELSVRVRSLLRIKRYHDDLKDALDRQTAIGEVLRVIGSSAFQIEPVLHAVAQHAARLCHARNVVIWRTLASSYRQWVVEDAIPEYTRVLRDQEIPLGTDTIVGRAHLEKRPILVGDTREYYRGATGPAADMSRLGVVRTLLAVPLVHDDRVVGVISLIREASNPFSAEEVLGVLRDYHRVMGELIVDHHGTLEHFAGDGMMVFFNDPLPVERHELQAVRMACAMRERFDGMAGEWRKRGYELGFGVGIATGYATLGRIGFEGRYDYGAVGNVVILAQRLSAEANAGQILISQRVHAAVEADAETTAVGELALKGFSRPVPAFAAESVKAPAPART